MKKTLQKAKEAVDEIAGVIKADFSINRLQMDAKLCWLLDLEVRQVLPETYLRYKLDLVFNEEPYEENIERIEKEIESAQNEASLFETHKVQRVKNLYKQIDDIRADMKELEKNCPTITIEAVVTELKYKNAGTTFIRMRLPDDKINELNDNKAKFSYYRAELTPHKPELDLDKLGLGK